VCTAKNYAPWLWLLWTLFLSRVLGQLLAYTAAPSLLPDFEAWHSAILPYWLLVISQLLILLIFAHIAWSFTTGRIRPNFILGNVLLIIGGTYFIGMLIRLSLGLTLYSDHRWFSNHLPTFFHLVLASFLLLVGHFHYWSRKGRSA
jgi:uncharacterized protein